MATHYHKMLHENRLRISLPKMEYKYVNVYVAYWNGYREY